MFSAASAHPAVKTISAVTPEQTEEINKQAGHLFTTLLADSCKQKTKQAIINEGQTAIRDSFKVLGQVASQEMFNSPEVSAGMAGLQKHFDLKKLESIMQ